MVTLDFYILGIIMFIESFDKHYYDEEDIDAGKPITCQVVVNHTIVLTEEEKAQARQKLFRKHRTKPTPR